MTEKKNHNDRFPATDSPAKPGDFPIGSPESRAAARLRLEQLHDNGPRIELISHIQRPRQDNTQPHASPWQQTQDGLRRVLYVPPGMDVSEARRGVRE